MNFLDVYYENIAAKMKNRKSQDEFLLAILRYYYDGEEPDFKSEVAEVAFEGIRFSLNKARAGRSGGKANGEAKREAKAKANPEANGEASSEANLEAKCEAEPEANQEANCERNGNETANKGIGIGKGIGKGISSSTPSRELEEGACSASFPLSCLDAFNFEFGTTYGFLPPPQSAWLQSMEGKYTLDEVKAMIRYKRDEWQGTEYQRNLTPNTLFSPEHFEQYIHQSKMPKPTKTSKNEEVDDELLSYASF